MKIKILKETPDYLVLSKPDGISVHEGAGEAQYTLVDWLKEKYPGIENLSWHSKTRLGIVHRLDKDTTGVLIVAKNPEALEYYQDQFKIRNVEKYYRTLVAGKPPFQSGRIDALIRRDPKDRERQRVDLLDFGLDEMERKTSATEYNVLKTLNYKGHIVSYLDIKLLTGRKHQIRVHMKYENCPVIGDMKYFNKESKRISRALGATRQFLHAYKIKFTEYKTGNHVEIEDELPHELSDILDKVK